MVRGLYRGAPSAKLPLQRQAASGPAVDIEPIDSTPMPYLPASVMPDGLIIDATTNGRFSCNGRICSARVAQREPVALRG